MNIPNRRTERKVNTPTGKKESDSVLRMMAPAILSIILCAVCLAGLTWAWFSVSTTCGVSNIEASEFTVSTAVKASDNTEVTPENGNYTLAEGNTYTVTLSATGTASTGYCTIKFGENTVYHTSQMSPGSSLTFTVAANEETTMVVDYTWATYKGYQDESLIGSGSTITIGTAPTSADETETGEAGEETPPENSETEPGTEEETPPADGETPPPENEETPPPDEEPPTEPAPTDEEAPTEPAPTETPTPEPDPTDPPPSEEPAPEEP